MDIRYFARAMIAAIAVAAALCSASPSLAATTLNFTVTASKPVNVDTTGGVPRLKLNIGGVDRYATYASGTGTASLIFTYTTQAGDLDLDGVAVISPLELNGGTILDGNMSPLSPLTFTLPVTSGLRVNHPYLATNFIANDYLFNGTRYNSLSSFLTAAGGSFTRATTATAFNSSGTLVTAAANAPRFDYDPVTHAAKGLLIEETRVNRQLYSEVFGNPVWAQTEVVLTSNAATAPDGTPTADKFVESTNNNFKFINQDITLVSGQPYTQSFFVKAAGRSFVQITASTGFTTTNNWANYNLATGTLGNVGSAVAANAATITNIGNGWYRCALTSTATSSSLGRFLLVLINGDVTTRIPMYIGDGSSGIYVWGAQLESATSASSYIPTSGSTVQRDADNLSLPTSSWFNPAASTLAADYASYAPSLVSTRIASFNDGGANQSILQLANSSTGIVLVQKVVGGTMSLSSGPTYVPNTPYKVAAASDAASTPLAVNATLYNNTNAGTPAGITRLDLGSIVGGNFLHGWLGNFAYYPSRVPNSQLQLLTQ